mmetsp:Transcript_23333/g.66898  ORF Transcript_23333/g.66898 Transcript_23333/m.66898 type:complete len:435 (-) Transcript_23333:244-1548(-)
MAHVADGGAGSGGGGGEGSGSTRFSSPPGLEGAGELHGATGVEAVRQALMSEIDGKVTAKVDELWKKANTMMGQVLKKQQESTERMREEITRCLEKQKVLEQEKDELKQVLLTLSERLRALSVIAAANSAVAGGGGSGWGGSFCIGSPGAFGSGASTATGLNASPCPAKSRPDSLFASPGAGGASATLEAPLPELPPFPFPAAMPSTTTPLCLAEALGGPNRSPFGTPAPSGAGSGVGGGTPVLGAGTPQQPPMALSLANSLASPIEVFSFTLRKADETELGLNLNVQEGGKVLNVEGIRADGAVDAWNRQCMGGACPGKAVMVGDKIIGVNTVAYDPEKMLEECKEKRLLRLTIFRGDGPLPDVSTLGITQPQAGAAAGKGCMGMRAEASEFVPRGFGGKASGVGSPGSVAAATADAAALAAAADTAALAQLL